MNIRLKKALPNVMLGTLAAVALVVQAAPGKSQGLGGWESSADHLESAVVSIKSSPVVVIEIIDEEGVEERVAVDVDEEATEAACVAVQIGMNLLTSELKTCAGETTAVVTPADHVSLFLTLGGVEVVAPPIGDLDSPPMCQTPCGLKPLTGLVSAFAQMPGASVAICPLCWNGRYPEDAPSVGSVLNGAELHDLFLFADKVIDF